MVKTIRFSALAVMFLFLKETSAQNLLGLEGGFEGSATIDNSSTYTTGQPGKWTKANANQTISSETSVVRSGNNSLKINCTNPTTGQRCYSPTFTVTTGVRYVIQYYRRVADTSNSQQSYSKLSLDGTTGSEASVNTYSTCLVNNTWEKVTYAPSSLPFATTIWAAIMHRQLGTGGDMYIDDFAVYQASSVDNSAPASASAFGVTGTTTSSIDLGWTASPDVDGGGYMLVRYTSNPAATDDPNENGIYANGQTIPGSVNGTIIYIGTGTSYTDAGLATSTAYYYKLYTFDKAYNYSAEQTTSSTTSGTVIYQTAGTGNWNQTTTWASNNGSGWTTPAVSVPDYTQETITILSGHTVTITADVTVDQVVVNSGATLVLGIGSKLELTDAIGSVDLDVQGTFIDSSTSGNGLSASSTGTWRLGNSGTFIKGNNSSTNNWRNAYENGISNIPATSTWIVRQMNASVTISSSGMYYGNLIIENTSANAWNNSAAQTFSGGTAPVIKGNLDIGGTGSNTVNFVNSLTVPLTVNGNLTVRSGSSFTLQNSTSEVNVTGNFIGGNSTTSSVSGAGKIILNGNSLQQLSGKTNFQTLQLNNTTGAQLQSGAVIGIYKALELKDGTFNVNNQSLTFYAQAVNSYAYLDNFSPGFSGNLTGNVTAQLRVPGSGTNQHYIGSPMSNATLAQFGASGTAGYVIPYANCDETRVDINSPYGTVFSWDETNPLSSSCPLSGWYVETSGTANVGKGYSAYVPSGTFSLVGAPNQSEPYSINGLANSGYLLSSLQRANRFSSGWHLLANPYLAPYDIWSYISSSSDFDDAYVWETQGRFSGTYQSLATYHSGLLAPFQGVMVHRGNGSTLQTPQSAATFQFNKSYLSTASSVAQFTRQMSESSLSVSIAGNGFEDITYVKFNEAATSAFDIGYDSRKMMSRLGQPTIFTVMNGERMSSNVNYSVNDVSQIPLSVSPGATGTFTFTFEGTETFDPTTYIYLEDKVTGIFQDVRANDSYTFTMNATDSNNRFVLHFTPPTEISTDDATCTTNGTINISQSGSAIWNYELVADSLVVAQGVLDSATAITANVPKGIYMITLIDSNNYSVTQEIEVSGVTPVSVALNVSTATAETGENITFTSTATNASSYAWDFGDGITSSAGSATHSYHAEGVYNVSLTASNADGCVDIKTQPITITAKTVSGLNNLSDNNAIKIWSNGNTVLVDLASKKTNATIDIFNVLGQQLSSERFNRSAIYSKTIEDVATGYVLVRVKTEKETAVKRVFVAK